MCTFMRINISFMKPLILPALLGTVWTVGQQMLTLFRLPCGQRTCSPSSVGLSHITYLANGLLAGHG